VFTFNRPFSCLDWLAAIWRGLSKEEESMADNWRYWTLGTVLLAVILGSPTLTPGAWAQGHYKILHTFKGIGSGGLFPESGLIMDQAGNLYGTTANGGGSHNCGNLGCGTVFELTPGANGKWTEKVLHGFTGNDGEWPEASLIFDQAGNLYGTTYGGGAHGAGTVFQLTPNSDGTWTENVLHAFCSSFIQNQCADGSTLLDGLTFDQAGNLYGTTAGGGQSCRGSTQGCGTVFEMTRNSDGTWTEQVLYSFCRQSGCRDGRDPESSGVTFDQAGNLYGTTRLGGNIQCEFGCGVAFRLSPNADGSWTEKVLHVFCSRGACPDGAEPDAKLILDEQGNLFSTTILGGNGACGCGVAFELTPNASGSWEEKVLHSFDSRGGSDGKYPGAPLTFDQAGNLYGTTVGGGFAGCDSGCGTVFKLTPNSTGGWHETILHAFQDHPGARPGAGVIFDALGNLYGTTIQSQSDKTFGSVFEITP
jgi:uncharacterized repeat protein (TIGR03803 family)